jgi:predicted component of type VI protein secretion system
MNAMNEALLKQLKQKVEEELRQRETALLEFWLKELKAIDARRHQDLAGLQTDLRGFIARLETRLRSVKAGSF